MKTVFKTLADSRKANQKRRDFEARTGLKWDCYHTGAGMRFVPVITRETPIDKEKAKLLEPYLTQDGNKFTALSEISGMNLTDVLIAAKTLVGLQKAIPMVNRNGGFAAIRKK